MRFESTNQDDYLIGTDEDEVFIGSQGADLIWGGGGLDTVDYSTSSGGIDVRLGEGVARGGDAEGDTLYGIDKVIGSAGRDILGGHDYINEAGWSDALYGGRGNDTLLGSLGADILDGGQDFDTVDYSSSTQGVIVNLREGWGQGGYAEGDRLNEIEGVIGSNFDDVLYAGGNYRAYTGTQGVSRLHGGKGNDMLIATSDSYNSLGDYLDGGEGYDTVSYAASDLAGGSTAQGVVVVLEATDGTGPGLFKNSSAGGYLSDALDDHYISIENIIGSGWNDEIYGASTGTDASLGGGNDIFENIASWTGQDNIHGGSGDDWIATGGGDDSLFGDSGNDKLFGEGGNDRLLGGDGNDLLDGGEGYDVLFGDSGKDLLFGAGGDDRLLGGDGSDLLDGGEGHDVLYGETGHDTLSGGAGNDRLFGGDGGWTVYDGEDDLNGGVGNDYLDGGDGGNILTGGAGDDLFVCHRGYNTITDFEAGVGSDDVIEFTTSVFADFDAVLAASSQRGTDVLIGHISGLVWLENVNLTDLHATDFQFV